MCLQHVLHRNVWMFVWTHMLTYPLLSVKRNCVCVCVCVCDREGCTHSGEVCVCVCVCDRETCTHSGEVCVCDRERVSECVCVCVCVRESVRWGKSTRVSS